MSLINDLPQTIYCERGFSSAVFAEPINAFTNFAFFIAGFLSYQFIRRKKIRDKHVLILPWLLATIGLGSILYHTQRNNVTLLLDAIPIYIFTLYILFLTLKELFQSSVKSTAILLGFVAIEVGLSLYVPKEFLNGSIRHVAAIIFISLIGWMLFSRFGNKVLKSLIIIISLYALAIVFRSIDMAVCPFFPIGTHFLWHTLAAFAGYQAIVLFTTLKSHSKS